MDSKVECLLYKRYIPEEGTGWNIMIKETAKVRMLIQEWLMWFSIVSRIKSGYNEKEIFKRSTQYSESEKEKYSS